MLVKMLNLYFQGLLWTIGATFVLALVYYYRSLSRGLPKKELRHQIFVASFLVIPIFSIAVMAILIIL